MVPVPRASRVLLLTRPRTLARLGQYAEAFHYSLTDHRQYQYLETLAAFITSLVSDISLSQQGGQVTDI